MNIEEAIRELQAALNAGYCPWSKHLKDATQLGIEALKRIEAIRLTDRIEAMTKLPGETEEER